ncbi:MULTISPECIES: transcription antitermination factor NusB [Corallincola]|uniref:Transcription antitermination protein NusB n=3 Tax=Corallincola TaxID=1775176 RepID=A0A368N4Z1_9GAMM|nr:MULTISPECIES: transcription antitermination factor NusB [Corallincola]RCU45240.1 transcription antitermination factor NusB [Corallincola holothuriorum]TAA43628.1 transcription antitermination factor NusB [Corallincola spongiicola]TCI02881.1 transcription antitermination factor NusB [Corallincola luteus]
MKPIARRKARRIALQAIYQWQMTNDSIADIELQYVTDNDPAVVDFDYFRDLLSGVASRLSELDAKLADFVSRPFAEVDQIDKAILRLGAYELMHRNDVPYRVVINEGIELAKSFASDDSHKFINGVLDKLGNSLNRPG